MFVHCTAFSWFVVSVNRGVLETIPCCQGSGEKLKVTLQPEIFGISSVWMCHLKDLKEG